MQIKNYKGDLHKDLATRLMYATDASVYQVVPSAVALPRNEQDVQLLIELANQTGQSLIPRTAGTSLAGQVVGSGIVVDVSKYMNSILEINCDGNYVRVQPGVIRDDLNQALRPYGLFFGPETSTANRAMIGGMVGNNSCGSNSLVYGSTRDKIIELRGFFADGSRGVLNPKTGEEFEALCNSNRQDMEAKISRCLREILSNPKNRDEISHQFPLTRVHRRNTGYALDRLMNTQPFGDYAEPFNLCAIIAGSEGTLFFATEIVLRCDPLPPFQSLVLCAHFESVDESLRANIIAMQHKPSACELIDRFVVEGAKRNLIQSLNVDFVVDDPAAILIVELRGDDESEIKPRMRALINEINSAHLGYAFPVLHGEETGPLWDLRKAGLGVLANCIGDEKPVTVIEDTAIAVDLLPAFINELAETLKSNFNVECVHYGHAGSGELHLRPVLNLKTEDGRKLFREVAQHTAALVKKFGGSLSGEHGDGRLRGEFIEQMVGSHNYSLFKLVKNLFDPKNIFNPGKIVDAPRMDQDLRLATSPTKQPETVFHFKETGGLLRAVEMCSGSGDCRKSHLRGGTMCPSYMATRNEKDSTRGRANILRHALTSARELDPLASHEVREVMDLCLSCKGCKSECPSNVDMAKIKAEFLQGYYDANGTPWRSRLIGSVDSIHRLGSIAPAVFNWASRNRFSSRMIKAVMGFHPQRSIPTLSRTSLRRWFKSHVPHDSAGRRGAVFLFVDEFTNYLDVPVGIAAVNLLERLGYRVCIPQHIESGRASISKGLLRKAQKIAIQNVRMLGTLQPSDQPIVGIEPSALLTLRDEYLDLVPEGLRTTAKALASRTLLIDEFLDGEVSPGRLDGSMFSDQAKTILVHGHCHQKAIASLGPTIRLLSLPANFRVLTSRAGCCGMAGSFGYEKEHYDVSMKIGELTLFPEVSNLDQSTLIAATGFSCRHQIIDGTGRKPFHPIEILNSSVICSA